MNSGISKLIFSLLKSCLMCNLVFTFCLIHLMCTFITNRQDQKKPAKKLVQPTLVLPQTDVRKDAQDAVISSSDNPVATAAAIAAAAASAATGPFLQVGH